MAKEERESIVPLKDGRTLFKTHNGFKYFVESKNKEVTEVTEDYWNKAKNLRKK